MSSIRQLKSRIRSVKNTKQITRAMEMVAASKMRRAQDATKETSAYAHAANELLTYLAGQNVTDNHPYFNQRQVKNRLLIVIASDKGLAGAYNSNILRRLAQELREDKNMGIGTQIVTIGRRVTRFVAKLKDAELIGAYDDMSDKPTGHELRTIVNTAINSFTSKQVDAVDIVFTKFHNAVKQEAYMQRILPAGYTYTPTCDYACDAKYEPSPAVVLDAVVYRLIESQVFQTLLDARASEHSMRMVAMKSATDNASDLVDDLTLEMNKARQGAITQELAEISGGVEAME